MDETKDATVARAGQDIVELRRAALMAAAQVHITSAPSPEKLTEYAFKLLQWMLHGKIG